MGTAAWNVHILMKMELIVFLMGQITCKGVAKKNSIKCFSLQNNLRVDYNNFIKI